MNDVDMLPYVLAEHVSPRMVEGRRVQRRMKRRCSFQSRFWGERREEGGGQGFDRPLGLSIFSISSAEQFLSFSVPDDQCLV